MADIYKVTHLDMLSVANAIREKTETTEQLVFPQGFVTAISNIDERGATLVVRCPSGVTVTVSKGDTSYTKTASADGTAIFKGITTGTWTVTITNGSQTAQENIVINADYQTSIDFFKATINITYPSGSVCTVTDGVTTLSAPNTSGSWTCVVPNTGTWTAVLDSGLRESVTITQNGQTTAIEHWFLYNNGNERTDVTGGWTAKGMLTNSGADSHMEAMAPTVAKNTTSVKLSIAYKTDNSKYRNGIYCINRKIDLTNLHTLSVTVGDVDYYQDTSVSLTVLSTLGTYFDNNKIANKGIATGLAKKTVELDVSGISGEQYICLRLMANPWVSAAVTLYAMEAR